MIRKFVLLIAVLALQGMFVAYAGNNIMQLNNVTAPAGENIVVNLEVINEDAFVGLQLDVPLPTGFGYVASSAVLNPARSNGHIMNAAILPGTNTFRVLAFSLSNAAFIGNSGTVASFSFTTSMTSGTYPLPIVNGILGNIAGQNIITGTVSGEVILTGTATYNVTFVVIDENQAAIPDATVTLGSVTNPAVIMYLLRLNRELTIILL